MNFFSKLYWQLLPGICISCRQDSHRPLDLCRYCEDALPYLHDEHPCASCALPQECVLPQECALPHEYGQVDSLNLCAACTSNPKPWKQMIAVFIYEGTISRWIQLCKYRSALVEQRVLASLAARQLANTPLTIDIIVPVPLSRRRLWQRGHNQALGFARIISRQLGIPLQHQTLKRIRHTSPQQRLSRSLRLKNLRNAFVASCAVSGKVVALIDDVVTTQTTVTEATKALLQAGAVEVHVWAIARVLR